MSESSLRRSTRRNQKKRGDTYSAGDVLEFNQTGATVHGRLVIKISEEPPRWLVTFDDGDLKDEEFPEESLGAIVQKAEDSDNGSGSIKGDAVKPKNGNKKKSLRHNKGSGSGSDDSGSPDSKKRKTSPSIDIPMNEVQSYVNAGEVSPASDSGKSGPTGQSYRSRVSDREERSRRRQEMIELEKPGAELLAPAPFMSAMPLAKKSKTKGGEDVIKIPMLTGTLYLYRGARRRVAFVRKF